MRGTKNQLTAAQQKSLLAAFDALPRSRGGKYTDPAEAVVLCRHWGVSREFLKRLVKKRRRGDA